MYRIFIADDAFDCPAGSSIYIPAEQIHGFRVGDAPSRQLNLYVPAAVIGYFDDLSGAISAGDSDPSTVDDIGRQHGMDDRGPVPEGYR